MRDSSEKRWKKRIELKRSPKHNHDWMVSLAESSHKKNQKKTMYTGGEIVEGGRKASRMPRKRGGQIMGVIWGHWRHSEKPINCKLKKKTKTRKVGTKREGFHSNRIGGGTQEKKGVRPEKDINKGSRPKRKLTEL